MPPAGFTRRLRPNHRPTDPPTHTSHHHANRAPAFNGTAAKGSASLRLYLRSFWENPRTIAETQTRALEDIFASDTIARATVAYMVAR